MGNRLDKYFFFSALLGASLGASLILSAHYIWKYILTTWYRSSNSEFQILYDELLCLKTEISELKKEFHYESKKMFVSY